MGKDKIMNKREFLETLREALSQEMPASLVKENIQYYSQYIDGEIEKGCQEREAVARLGEPRLIAKTLLEAFEATGQTYGSDGQTTAYQNGSRRNSYSEGDYGTADGDWASESRKNQIKLSKEGKIHLVIGILIVICVLVLIVSLISALLPIVLPVVAVLLILSYLQKRL